MKKEIEEIVKKALINLGINQDVAFSIEHPDEYGGKNLEEVRKELRSKVFNESWDSIAKYWSKYF
ncbi:MAG: hypothetical protein PHW20_11285 [Clostridia bacterium]|nr:hypothetical protein [Clostridia bacterium]